MNAAIAPFHLVRFRCFAAAWLAVAVACLSGSAFGQEAAEGKGTPWTRLETSEETRAFKDRLREGGAFDAASRNFLVQQALPQIARPENRSSIERVRRRIREVLLTEIANEQAFREANRTVLLFMDALARDEAADAAARVNAAMLMSELRGSDNRPWIDAVPALSSLAKDAKVAMAVRVAAVSGLSRYGAAFAANPQAAGEAGAAALSILSEATKPRPEGAAAAAAGSAESPIAGRDWLVGRAASLLPLLSKAYPKNVAEPLARIVADASQPADVRVRAAASLGAGVGPQSQVEAGKLLPAIESLGIDMLSRELDAADAKRFEQEYRRFVAGVAAPAGMGPRSGMMGVPMGGEMAAGALMIPQQSCRRQAWRLVMLAEALAGPDGSKGLVAVSQGADAEKARQLAKVFRDGGMKLDADPSEASLELVLDAIRQVSKPAAGGPPGRPGAPVEPARPVQPGTVPEEPSASPFDTPSNTSPFN